MKNQQEKRTSAIPDNKNLKLAIFSPNHLYDSDLIAASAAQAGLPAEVLAQAGKGKKFATELFEKVGTGFRIYKNTLFVLAMQDAQYITLAKSLKQFWELQRSKTTGKLS